MSKPKFQPCNLTTEDLTLVLNSRESTILSIIVDDHWSRVCVHRVVRNYIIHLEWYSFVVDEWKYMGYSCHNGVLPLDSCIRDERIFGYYKRQIHQLCDDLSSNTTVTKVVVEEVCPCCKKPIRKVSSLIRGYGPQCYKNRR